MTITYSQLRQYLVAIVCKSATATGQQTLLVISSASTSKTTTWL